MLSSMDEIAGPVPEMPGENRDALTSGGGSGGGFFWDDVIGGWRKS